MSRTLYVARHGETDWNLAGRWQGHTDVPLNGTGRAQARALARAVGKVKATLAGIVSSDLARASETARIAGAELGVAVAYADRDLRERSFGIFEGLTRDECQRLHADAWRAWVEEREVPGNAETAQVLTARVVAAVERAATRVARDDAAALVVTHGGALRALVTAVTGEMPPPVQNGAVWRVEWDGRLVAATPM
jgi:broad specificity phosphatase PhoE